MERKYLRACMLMLKPIAGFLIQAGMTWQEFSDVSKKAFVDVVADDYGIDGRKTNLQRTSIITGINRRTVKKIRDEIDADNELVELDADFSNFNVASRLLRGWYKDPDFVDENEKPLVLHKEGKFPSFTDLHQRYCKDISIQAILKELLLRGAVEVNEEGQYKVLSREWVSKINRDRLRLFSISIADIARNFKYNNTVEDKDKTIYSSFGDEEDIPLELAEEFNKLMHVEATNFMLKIDDWLVSNKVTKSDAEDYDFDKTVRLGLGVYGIYDEERTLERAERASRLSKGKLEDP